MNVQTIMTEQKFIELVGVQAHLLTSGTAGVGRPEIIGKRLKDAIAEYTKKEPFMGAMVICDECQQHVLVDDVKEVSPKIYLCNDCQDMIAAYIKYYDKKEPKV